MFTNKVKFTSCKRKNVCTKVACRSPDPYEDRMGVFQLHPNVYVSLKEVREAYDMRRGGRKGDFYAVFGMNGENVERYLPVVERLESSFKMTDKKNNVTHILWNVFCNMFYND